MNQASFPVVFIHSGGIPLYLGWALIQAHTFNTKQPIYLISNEKLPEGFEWVRQIHIRDVFKSAEAFGDIYRHWSINEPAYECFCMRRWFILHELMQREGLERCLYLDSDVLLFCRTEDIASDFPGADFTINRTSPHCSAFFSRAVVEHLCRLMTDFYSGTMHDCFAKIVENVERYEKPCFDYNICDMCFTDALAREGRFKAAETSLVRNGAIYDHNMNDPRPGFEMADGIKKMEWVNGMPYGTLTENGRKVRFRLLHFQGGAKDHLQRLFKESASAIFGTSPA